MNTQRYVWPMMLASGVGAMLLAVFAVLATSLQPAVVQAQGMAQLRAVHAVPDAGAVDVYINGTQVVTGFEFFTATTYLEVAAGEIDLAVVPENGDPATEAVISESVTLEPDTDYSAVARGAVGITDTLGATLLTDENVAPQRGYSLLRAAHFAPDAPTSVDIAVNGTTVISGLEYLSASEYLPVAAGSYTVTVAPAGESAIYTATLAVESGQVVTAWANGLVGPVLQQGDGPEFKVTPTVDANYAYVRGVHAVPDLPFPVDVYLDDDQIASFDFFDTTDYLPVMKGQDYTLRVVPTGGDPDTDAAITEVLSGTLLDDGSEFSLVARGTASTSDDADLGATLLTDDNSAPSDGQSTIRFAHFGPDAPQANITVRDTDIDEDVAYIDAMSADLDYLEVDPGTYTFLVSFDDSIYANTMYTTTATLTAGSVYTGWLNGLLEGSGDSEFKLTITEDQSFGAYIRALHAIPNAPPVDVLVDGEAVVTNLAFGEVSDYLPVAAGSYEVALRATGATEILYSETIAVPSGEWVTVAAIGLVPDGVALAQDTSVDLLPIIDDRMPPADGQAKVRAAHLSPDAPTVDLVVGGNVVFDDISYPETTEYLEVGAGVLEAEVTSADNSQTFLNISQNLIAGSNTTVYVIGLADAGAPADQALRALAVTDLAAEPQPDGMMLYLPIISN